MCKLVIKYDPILGDVMPDGKVQQYIDDTIVLLRNTEHSALEVKLLWDLLYFLMHSE